MQSHSRSHLRPAFNHLTADGKLAASLGSDNPPSAEQLHLWSNQQPSLTVGNYAISVSQEITLPTGEAVPALTTPAKALRVSKPKFQLADPADLHSVHPAPGHSAYARTLANVVFSHPTIPWERDICPGKDFGFNKLPSMAVLTFSEEELVLDPEAYKGLGFAADYERPTECGSVVTRASRLIHPACAIKSTLNAPGAGTDFKPSHELSLLLLDSELFKNIFTAYGNDNQPNWTGNADLSKFASMACTQESDSGFTASSFVGSDDADAHRPRFSVIASPRTGPPGIASPTRVVSHLVSLEDVDKITLSADRTTGQYVGLVSLHAWEWMAVPEDAADFAHIMTELGMNINPLQGPYSERGSPEALEWSKAKADAGYVLKPHTDVSGTESLALIRGPLIPVKPGKKPFEAFSLYGEGLALVDKITGIPDVSLKSAWTLGRSMMMADRALSASLLRLRGNIHAEAVRRAKAKGLYQRGYRALSSKEIFLAGLEDAVKHLEQAQDIGGIGSGNPAGRWTRSDNANLPVVRLSNDTSYSHADYQDQVGRVTLHMFGYESNDSDGNTVPVRQIDADAAAIRAWAVDRFLLAGVPLHSLVLDPDMLPPESIRTFCVDNNWIDFLVDGGLSLANHFARDDDAIRRAVKECINKYLATPITDGGTIPQLPRWGFFLRSEAVSAFPDLRIEAPLPAGAPQDAREVLFMQVLAEDVLICLFDRLPGEQELDYIRICQPHHQQGFSLGTRLSGKELTVHHRAVPMQTGQNLGPATEETFKDDEPVFAFDFKARMLRPSAYMEQYHEAIKDMEGAFTHASKPSSLLATQLRGANLRLQLNPETSFKGDSGASDRWTNATFQLSVGSQPGPDDGTAEEKPPSPGLVRRAPPSNDIVLPTGPRRQIRASVSPYAYASVASKSSGPDVSEKLHQPEPSSVLPYSATPQHVNCCLCYEPGNTSNLIYATEAPTDLIFNLSAEESSGFPAEAELRVPVALGSRVYPPNVKDGSRGLIVIPGNAGQPILPVLEDLNSSRWWSYECKLAVSSLYSLIPEALPKEGDHVPTESEKLVMLVIKIKPRFENLVPPHATAFKTSFLLRGVTVLLPAPDPSADPHVTPSRNARFDLLWRSGSPGGETSVRTAQLTIRPAIVVTIQEDSIKFTLEKQDLSLAFVLSRMPPEKAQVRLVVTQQGRSDPFTESFELWATPQPQPDGRGFLFTGSRNITSKLFEEFVPLEMRLAMVEPNGPVLGPDSAPFVFPQLPDIDRLKGSCCYYWGADHHLSIIWPPLKGLHVLIKRKFTIYGQKSLGLPPIPVELGDETGIVRFDKKDLSKYGLEQGGLEIVTDIMAQHARIDGRILHWNTSLSKMPEIREVKLLMLSHLKDPGLAPPMPLSRFPSMRYWTNYGKATRYMRTHLWYWRSSKRALEGLHCNTLFAQAYECPGPEIATTQPELTGAGALAVMQMYQEHRFKIVWIGSDGSVNLWSREDEKMERENWRDSVLAPPGSASTLGGGSLAVCGEVPIDELRGRRNPVIWWLGPRGEIFGRRARSYPSEHWADVGPGASLPAGSIDISPSLTRPAQMATAWAYDSDRGQAAYLFWVHSNGDLMATCSYYAHKPGAPPPKLSTTAIAYRNVGAAPGTSLTAFIGANEKSPSPYARVYLLWVSSDGSICLGSRDELVETTNAPEGWDTIVNISSPGCANPFSDLCLLGHTMAKAAAVVWADPNGKLQIAWAQSRPGSGQNEWLAWGWRELPCWLPAGQAPIIARSEADKYDHHTPTNLSSSHIYIPAGEGKWTTYSVNLGSM
ncbi:hypothetical protein B0J13DRAFT_566935 [Dactylonectria estremocensis]|uniref:Uncharacterized protein n=1 Tax=Dactylonectria estremocensis TaxID=1079267 RepID=A0A9P9IK09_9HYPO|nr:hypothetical protein B0J13DRAFT_566935 [Dactylonectria estremocensis]